MPSSHNALVAIPSRSRFSGKLVVEQIQDLDLKTALFVPDYQWTYYVEEPENTIFHTVLSCPVDGIAATRRYMSETAQEMGYSKIIMVDDDIEFYIRRPGVINLRKMTPAETNHMFNRIAVRLGQYKHVGVGHREGHGHVKDDYAINSRYIRLLAYDVETHLSCEHGRVPVMEDFDIALQLLRRGFPSYIYYCYGQGQKKTQSPGGCSDYRTKEKQAEAAYKLAALHPGFVKIRVKRNKTGGDFGTRTEVTIYWKKAYDSSHSVRD